MTKEEFIKKYSKKLEYMADGDYFTFYIEDVLTEIYNDLVKDKIDNTYYKRKEQLKAKDEEIEELKTWLSRAVKVSSESIEVQNLSIKNFEAERKKVNSIVALLFWEMKKRRRVYLNNKSRSAKIGWGVYEQANLSSLLFNESYRILKD